MNFNQKKKLWLCFLLFKSRATILLFLGMLLIFCSLNKSFAQNASSSTKQQIIVRGKVIDHLSEPLIGATLMEVGTNNGVVTDFNGEFSISVSSSNAQLKVSYIGYETATVLARHSELIVLKDEGELLEEVMVIGYGSQKKESVVGSITQVNSEEIKSRGPMSSMTDALSGSMPGVTVMTSTGVPGGGGNFDGANESTILIRGLSTWNNSSPLVLVDGVERNMNDIDINEVETFSVLKDASATAVFGVKGANGVILITTKRGQIGKPVVSFEANVSFKDVSKIAEVRSAYDGLLSSNYGIVNELSLFGDAYMEFYTPKRVLDYYRDGVDPEKYPDVDWKDVMTNDNAMTQKYSFNISGGTDVVKYFTTLSYLNDGDLLNSKNSIRGYSPSFKYERYNFRSNFDFSLTKTTTLKVNLSGYYGQQQSPGRNTSAGTNTIYNGLYKYSPTHVPIYSDGVFGADDDRYTGLGMNSFFYLVANGTYKQNRTSVTTDFDLNQKLDFITKGLSVKAKFSYDNYFTTVGANVIDDDYSSATNPSKTYIRKYWDVTNEKWVYVAPALGADGFDSFMQPLSYTAETTTAGVRRNLYYEGAINYARTFGKHSVSALALFSRQENTVGTNWTSKREDWVGRVTYDYDGTYLFEMNAAYNGSEKFSSKYKFDFFPSFAVGYRLSNEEFIRENVEFLSNLKFKYSLGWVGNDNLSGVGMWPYLTIWEGVGSGSNPSFGYPQPQVSQYPGYVEGTPGNPDVRWEKVRKQNIGVEFGFFNQAFTGSIDYFMDHRYDMLIAGNQRTIPNFYGQTPPAANIGIVDSEGWEIEVKYQNRINKFNYWVSANWTQATNTIKYKEDPELRPDYQKQAGHSINQNYSQIIDNIIPSWNDLYTGVMYESSTTNGNVLPGDYRMVDYNGDGVINGNDSAPYGHTKYPKNTYGFALGGSYKGFSLSAQFYGVYNVNQGFGFLSEHDYGAPTIYDYQLENTFTPEYGISNPTYRALNYRRNTPTGNAYLVDGSFLRLKSVELGYSLPKAWLDPININKARLFVNGNNLFYWSKLPTDIEGTDFNINNYPTMRQVNVGLNVTF